MHYMNSVYQMEQDTNEHAVDTDASNAESYVRKRFARALGHLWNIRSSKRKLIGVPMCIIGLGIICSWSFRANSSSLNALVSLIVFDVLTLLGDLTSQCFQLRETQSAIAVTAFGFPTIRIEVLIHFIIVCLGMLLNGFVIILGISLVTTSTNLELDKTCLLPATVIGGLIHFFLSFNNNSLLKVYKLSGSKTFLQEKFDKIFNTKKRRCSSFSQSPFALLGGYVTILLFGFYLTVLQLESGTKWIDFAVGILIILANIDTIFPLCKQTGLVLLQVVPNLEATRIEQALREALTIDGVLEFQNELFFTLSYGKIAGMLHVRVRRDADEQIVLSNVYEKLHQFIPHLTIQVTKDDFTRRFSHFSLPRNPNSAPVIINMGTSDISPIRKPSETMNYILYSTTSRSSNDVSNPVRTGGIGHHPVRIPCSGIQDDTYNASSSSIFGTETVNISNSGSLQQPNFQFRNPNALLRPLLHKPKTTNELLRNNFNPTEGSIQSFKIAPHYQ